MAADALVACQILMLSVSAQLQRKVTTASTLHPDRWLLDMLAVVEVLVRAHAYCRLRAACLVSFHYLVQSVCVCVSWR